MAKKKKTSSSKRVKVREHYRYKKPKRRVDRKIQAARSLNPTSRLSGGPGSAGPWAMMPPMAQMPRMGMTSEQLKNQQAMRPSHEQLPITQQASRERDLKNIINIIYKSEGGRGRDDGRTPPGAPLNINIPAQPYLKGETITTIS